MLETITSPAFLEHVREMGDLFSPARRAKEKYPGCSRVEQRGLMMGLIFASEDCGPRMSRALAKRGVIAVFSGFNRHILQLMPPLIIQPREIDEVLTPRRRHR
jgi:acetylornithine/succinyldiaminopimelate/putrescine aminotransferase